MESEWIRLRAYNVARVGNDLVFPSMDLNIIYALDMNTNNIRIWDSLPDENFFGEFLYGNIYTHKNGIVLVPLNAKQIWFFDYKTKNWVPIYCPLIDPQLEFKFYGVFEYNNFIYLLGFYYPGIIKINMGDFSVSKIDLTNKIQSLEYRKYGLFNWDYVIIENYFYTSLLCSNKVMKMDLNTEQIEFISLGNESNKYIGLVYDGEKIWFVPRIGNVYCCWRQRENVFKEYLLPNDYVGNGYCFGGAFKYQNKIYFTSFINKSVVFNMESPDNYHLLNKTFMFHKKIDGLGEVTQDQDGNIIIFGNDEMYMKGCIEKSKLDEVYKLYDLKKCAIDAKTVKESNSFTLVEFLKIL